MIMRKIVKIIPFLFMFFMVFLMTACSGSNQKEVRKNIEYTVCDTTRMPDELHSIIEEKKAKPFKLSYISGEYLYIAVGYGEHSRANYGVTVNDLFLTENAIYIDADLSTNDQTQTDAQQAAGEPSMYPYIVVKCEKIDKPVVFNVD